jgi:integrase
MRNTTIFVVTVFLFLAFKQPPGRVTYLELDGFSKLLKACPSWLKSMVVIAAYTGMRQREIRLLTRENIDLGKRMIVTTKTKNRERKMVPMHPTVFELLKSLPPRLDTPYLFAEKDGQPYTRHKVSMAFRRACRKAEIKDFRFHDLRHHFASHLTMSGQNQRTLMELLGHKDPRMTVRYQHLTPEYLKGAIDSLPALKENVEKG